MGALEGVRVIDFTQVIFGPSGTQVLADHGADVIKIERPGQGDLSRDFGPWVRGQSLPFSAFNRGKRSLAVDLKSERGQEIVHRLVRTSDVLAHNFRPGVIERINLGYEVLSRRYPGLVYVVGTGFGLKGPYADANKAGHDPEVQALTGAMYRNVGPDGVPRKVPLPICDFTGGMLLAQAVMLGLLARERTGRGQLIETSLMDAVIAMQTWSIVSELNADRVVSETGEEGDREGMSRQPSVIRNPLDGVSFQTSDGYIMLSAIFRPHPAPLRELCAALGIDDLSKDPMFVTREALAAHASQAIAIIGAALRGLATAEVVRRLEARDILCAPVRTPAEALGDPQLKINGMIIEIDHQAIGSLRYVGPPVHAHGTPVRPDRAAPTLGQHTGEILEEIGYSPSEVAALRASRVVA